MLVLQLTMKPASAGSLPPKASGNLPRLFAFSTLKFAPKLVVQLLHFIAHAMHERQVRRAAREIARFDDYMLRDLGITRSEIEHVVRYGRTHEPGPVRTIFDLEHRLND